MWEIFSQGICQHIVRRAVKYFDNTVCDTFAKRHDTVVNVARSSCNGALAKGTTGPVVFHKRSRGLLFVADVGKNTSEPQDFISAPTRADPFRLHSGRADGCLLCTLP